MIKISACGICAKQAVEKRPSAALHLSIFEKPVFIANDVKQSGLSRLPRPAASQ
jgi:hypothetical protein